VEQSFDEGWTISRRIVESDHVNEAKLREKKGEKRGNAAIGSCRVGSSER
jgi:hypothetical protein